MSSEDCTYVDDAITLHFKENDTKQETGPSQQLYKLELGNLTIKLVSDLEIHQDPSQQFIFRPVVNYFLAIRQQNKKRKDEDNGNMFGYVKTVNHLIRSNAQTINIAAALKGYNDNTGTVEVEMTGGKSEPIEIDRLELNLHK